MARRYVPKHATRLVHGSFDGHTDGETDGNVHLADGKARRIVSRVVTKKRGLKPSATDFTC